MIIRLGHDLSVAQRRSGDFMVHYQLKLFKGEARVLYI